MIPRLMRTITMISGDTERFGIPDTRSCTDQESSSSHFVIYSSWSTISCDSTASLSPRSSTTFGIMAPKSSATPKEKLIGDDDEVLQAVILADSFNKRFRPLTTHKPRVLHLLAFVYYLADMVPNSVCSRFAMHLYWTGRLKVLLLPVCRKSSSSVDLMRSR